MSNSKIIIHPQGVGLAIIYPTGGIPLDDVAKKDVPAGVPYLIVDSSEVPTDRSFRDAWTADFSRPHGYGIGAEAWFKEQGQQGGAA